MAANSEPRTLRLPPFPQPTKTPLSSARVFPPLGIIACFSSILRLDKIKHFFLNHLLVLWLILETTMATPTRTFLAYQHDAHLHTLQTVVLAVHPFTALQPTDRQLFKDNTENQYAIFTEKTIFHPQGGGQPSDTGVMNGAAGTFIVTAARMTNDGQVIHLGRFEGQNFSAGEIISQNIDVEKRWLFSRLHTAGHVLGSAVRDLLENEIENFDELKASHFPDSAACEFQGVIEGKWKDAIQKRLDELIAAKMPVQIEWWDEADFRAKGLERLIPDQSLVQPGEKSRVVNIVGAEVYPCGGTHVDSTDLCGPTTVKKISRKSGNSRVSYIVN
jgi:Ser-tRNA(Ala) deacylase AlaX